MKIAKLSTSNNNFNPLLPFFWKREKKWGLLMVCSRQCQAWAIQADRYLFNGTIGTVTVIPLLNGNGWVWKMAVILLLEPRSFTVWKNMILKVRELPFRLLNRLFGSLMPTRHYRALKASLHVWQNSLILKLHAILN